MILSQNRFYFISVLNTGIIITTARCIDLFAWEWKSYSTCET